MQSPITIARGRSLPRSEEYAMIAGNAAMSEGIWGSVMSYDQRAKVLILGVNGCPRIPRPGVAYGRAKLHTYGRDILK